MKFAVGQLGGRMYYGIPEILYRHNCLQHFYTDYVSSKFPFSAISNLPKFKNNLTSRKCNINNELISQLTFDSILNIWRIKYKKIKGIALHNEFYRLGLALEKNIIKHNFSGAKGIFMIGSTSKNVFRKAKELGISTISEQIIAPSEFTLNEMYSEWEKYPDWENVEEEKLALKFWTEINKGDWENADKIVCGSEFVKDCIKNMGGPYQNAVVIPYGVPIEPFTKQLIPLKNRKLRVLTIGAVGLRKGSPYIIEAAKQLKNTCEFRLLGSLPVNKENLIKNSPENVYFGGHIARNLLKEHFEWADVFLLPSLSEGSATVCYEALNYNLPLVVTHSTGQFFTHGKEGFYIKSKSTEEIVETLIRFIQHPFLLEKMSVKAKELATEGSLEAYENRILQLINKISL